MNKENKFTKQDMIDFIKFYDSKEEKDCYRTFEEEFDEWLLKRYNSIEIINKLNEVFEDENFILNVCLSYRHDFGLINDNERKIIKHDCKEWLRAIKNNLKFDYIKLN